MEQVATIRRAQGGELAVLACAYDARRRRSA